jgi:integrase
MQVVHPRRVEDLKPIPTKMSTEKGNRVPVAGLPGLYVNDKTGIYYTRYSLNGSRTWHSHKTDDLKRAKILHTEKLAAVEKLRQSGATLSSDFSTLASLETELRRIWGEDDADPETKEARLNSLARLKAGWAGLGKNWATTSARSVGYDTILSLRNFLSQRAKWKRKACHKTWQVGYSNPAVNYALRALHIMLDVAKRARVIVENPFNEQALGRDGLYLPQQTLKKVQLPTCDEMERVFAEMEKPTRYDHLEPALREHLFAVAKQSGRFARLLAYSGMRVGELAGKRNEETGKREGGTQVADDLGKHLHVRGTKTATSDRKIPINPALRAVLDEIKTERIAGPLVDIEDVNQALERACKVVGVKKLSHHDLRHYFATICIESGVDIPTVSRWLGHADGGVLAMKTYGHLRDEHSQAAMQKVNFGSSSRLKTA